MGFELESWNAKSDAISTQPPSVTPVCMTRQPSTLWQLHAKSLTVLQKYCNVLITQLTTIAIAFNVIINHYKYCIYK